MAQTTTESALKPLAPVDLAAERAALGPALEQKILEVLRSGHYILGPEVEKLEHDFAALHGVPHGVGVANGTDALVIALRAAGVKPGDHVVTTPFTFFASAGAIAWMGAKPVFADVQLDTALLDPDLAKRAIDSRTTAILPVHLYGQMADMQRFRAICDEKHLALVEDAAQSHAAKRDGQFCGQLGDACAFSFYPTKNLGACGEGGMVITRREDVYQRAKRIREHGSPVRYVHAELGTNSRLQAFQGAALNVKLPHLAAWTARRNRIADRFDAAFRGAPGLRPLARVPSSTHVFHQYTVRILDVPRDGVVERLKEKKIFVGVHYPSPVHLQEAARPWGYGPGDFQNSERLAREVICLPVHPFLSDADVDRIAENVLLCARGQIGARS